MENNNSEKPRRPRISRADASGESRGYGERTQKVYGSSNYGDRPQRNYGERPQRNYGEGRSYGDRPQRSYGGNDGRNFGERPQRSYGDRPQRNYGEGHGYGSNEGRGYDRPQRNYGGNSYGDRPQRSYNGESHGYGDRPQRSYGEGRGYGNGEGRAYGDRPQRSFGGGRPGGSRPQKGGFNKKKNFGPKRNVEDAATAGINRMISDRPQVDREMDSDNDMVMIPVKDVIRLNKFIANSGICSRREADNFIQAGVVTVNGIVVTELGTKINLREDDIRFNGERLHGEAKVYIVMNKPKGYVTTTSDPHADKVVLDLLKGCEARVFPIGRLDKNTTGVLMFTNDGEMAEKLTHPSYDKKKIYQVSLSKALSQEDYDRILAGVTLSDGDIAADDLQYIDENDHRKLGIEIHSGKNRIVRRIFESLGYDVTGLDRVYFAGVTKKGLKRGEWRYLSEGEVNILKIGAYK